jgi:hypothetical protein
MQLARLINWLVLIVGVLSLLVLVALAALGRIVTLGELGRAFFTGFVIMVVMFTLRHFFPFMRGDRRRK